MCNVLTTKHEVAKFEYDLHTLLGLDVNIGWCPGRGVIDQDFVAQYNEAKLKWKKLSEAETAEIREELFHPWFHLVN